MQYFLVQCGLTVLFTLLRWVFIWTKTTQDNFSWPIVNNIFFVLVISWLFTLGYFVKHRMEESLRKQLDHERRNVSVSESNYQRMEKRLTARVDELAKEKERFFIMAENMIAVALRMNLISCANQSDLEVVEKERAAMANFV